MSAEPLSISEFRAQFPEFTEENFPDAIITPQLLAANLFFNTDIYSDELRGYAMGLLVAHRLTLAARDGAISEGGFTGAGSAATGVTASKSVDGASISFDNSLGSEDGAGQFNLTRYGRDLWLLIRMMGMRPAYVQ